MKLKAIVSTVLFLTTLTHAAPTVDELLKKATEAAGGEEKLKRVKSMTMTGKVSMPAQNINGTMEMYKKPGKLLVTMNIPGIGEVRSGITDDIGYEMTVLMGARLLSESEKEQILANLDSNEVLGQLGQLKDVQVSGPEKINDRDAWKISGKDANGNDALYWLDAENHRLLRTRSITVHQMGKIESTTDFSEFKKFDGMEVPTVARTVAGPVEMEMTFEKFEFNPQIDDAKFALPDEVKKLAEKQKPATQPKEGA